MPALRRLEVSGETMGMGAGRLSGVGVFDFDGTLVDPLGEITSALNRVLLRHGRRGLSEAEVKILVGRGPETLLHRAWRATGKVRRVGRLRF